VLRTLTPAAPVRLRTPFKSRVDQRIFVSTLEEDLHKTFDLNALQRQSAAWSAQCCGIRLGDVLNRMEQAMNERRVSKIREQIRRELADLRAANAAATAAAAEK